jgi:hypothetical protein
MPRRACEKTAHFRYRETERQLWRSQTSKAIPGADESSAKELALLPKNGAPSGMKLRTRISMNSQSIYARMGYPTMRSNDSKDEIQREPCAQLKQAALIAMAEGATVTEIASWQPHTVRGASLVWGLRRVFCSHHCRATGNSSGQTWL